MAKAKNNITKPKNIVIVGGGTGGHITPALAVAEALKKQGAKVTFIGGLVGPESDLVKQSGYPFFGIQAGKLRRYLDWRNLGDLFRIGIGFLQARSILAKLRPDVVFAKGGYVSVPVVYAAAFLEIPIIAHESDVVMGLANLLTAEKSQLVCTGFPTDNYPARLKDKLRFTGNPVRQLFRRRRKAEELAAVKSKLQISKTKPTVLVIGGSQGALALNQLIYDDFPSNLERFQIIHLTGLLDHAEAVRQKLALSSKISKSYQPFAYVGEELADYMQLADLVVSRAGANTLAELATVGKPVLLIPLPNAANDHQRANAAVFAKKRAAVVIEQVDLTPVKLTAAVNRLLANKEKRQNLGQTIGLFRSPEAATIIAEHILAAEKLPDR